MPIKNITPDTLYKWLNQESVTLIDVRTPEEYATQRIYLSHSLPLSRFAFEALPKQHAAHLVLHCQKGIRSLKACQTLLQSHPDITVYNLEGGLSAWHADGLPTVSTQPEKTETATMTDPILRLLGMITGVLGVTAYLIHPLFSLVLSVCGLALFFFTPTVKAQLAVLAKKLGV